MSVDSAGRLRDQAHAPSPARAARRSVSSGHGPLCAGLIGACFALGGLSLLLPWATTYDPWAWIVWGREITQLDLSTVSGPSWKPLPVVFTTPFALAGPAAPLLWLALARGFGLLAIVAMYAAARRLAGPVAAVAAAVALALNLDFVRTVWLGNSEGLLVCALILGVERQLSGKQHHAFWCGVAAALLRPEVWPFLALYAAWLVWRRELRIRTPVLSGGAVLCLWLLPELWGSGELWRAAGRALQPVAAAATFAPNPTLAVIEHVTAMLLGPVPVAAALAVAFSVARLRRARTARDLAVLVIAALAVAWIALVAAMTAHGFSGNSRYVMAPVALICVLAGAGLADAALVVSALIARRRASPVAAAAIASALVAAGLAPFALGSADRLGAQLASLEYQAELRTSMTSAIHRAGGPRRLLACGLPATEDYSVPMLAWYLGVHVSDVGLTASAHGVVFQAAPGPLSDRDPLLGPRWWSRQLLSSGPVDVFARCRADDDLFTPGSSPRKKPPRS